MPMEETGGIFDNFLDYQNVDRMELFEENGNIAESYPLQINTVYAISLKDPAN